MERTEGGLTYNLMIGKEKRVFSVRYEQLQQEHMVNSVIEGEVEDGKKIRMVVDGHLCPFATAGVILIVVGSALSS